MINTAETLKGQLFVGLRNIANLPIAKAIKSKMDAAINYLDNLASRLTAAVKKVFKQADGQIDDVADEAAESLAKQTDEIDPPGNVCVIGRSSRIGASTRACNGNGLVGEEIAKKLDNMKFPSKDEFLDGVSSQKIKNQLNEIYKEGAKVGDGSTFAAVVSELKTGNPVGGKFHFQKCQQLRNSLTNILDKANRYDNGNEQLADYFLTSLDRKAIDRIAKYLDELIAYIP